MSGNRLQDPMTEVSCTAAEDKRAVYGPSWDTPAAICPNREDRRAPIPASRRATRELAAAAARGGEAPVILTGRAP